MNLVRGADELVSAAIEPEPIPPIALLLQQVSGLLRQYIVFPSDYQVVACALWTVHTHAIDAAEVTPYLLATSPERRSGKTRLQDVLDLLVARPWRVVNPSEAVLFRKVHKDHPTLLLDEVDAIWGKDAPQYEGLRALLNAGHRRGVTVPRMAGEGTGLKVMEFDVFGAKCIAGIGAMPDTVADRSIPIRLHRRAPEEHITRFRFREAAALAAPIRTGLERWAEGHLEELREARPELPDIHDRAADSWEPLLAIADSAGGDWPSRARLAAVALHAEEFTRSETFGIRLLADIRDVFASHQRDRIPSVDLAKALAEAEEGPWGDLRGRPLDPRKLADLLRQFEISPRDIKTGERDPVTSRERVVKGYRIGQFAEAWSRYLPDDSPRGPGLLDSERYSATPQVDGPFPTQEGNAPGEANMAFHLHGSGVADESAEEGG
jgi:hypothetical protein